MAAISKAFASLLRKGDRSDAKVGEFRELHTLAWKSPSAHDFALKSSAQMARSEFTQTCSFEQLLSHEYPQESANFMYR